MTRVYIRTGLAPSLLFIDSVARLSASSEFFDPSDPRAGPRSPQWRATGADKVDQALRAARAATGWRKWRPVDRGKVLGAMACVVSRNKNELAALESMGAGKPLG